MSAQITPPDEPTIYGPDLIRGWPALRDWRLPDDTSSTSSRRPNLDHLRDRYGHHIVQVADTRKRQYNEFERSERPLKNVIDLWTEQDPTGDGLYVKDWHLALQLEEDGGSQAEFYTTPKLFQDDWMTHHALSLRPRNDYRFTYMGPKGTFTPLHRDVYGSYSWSSNVIGRKRWWLIPPDIRHRFQKHTGQQGPGEPEMLFDLRELSDGNALEGVVILEQGPGETIHVPSGWYHQVENLDFCISINHNYANSRIIRNIYNNLLASLCRVEESIVDILPLLKQRLGSEPAFRHVDGRDQEDIFSWEVEWIDEVQKVLEMDAGWGLAVFWDMVLYNIESPPAPCHLRPSDEYLAAQILPIIADFKTRREWRIMRETRITVLRAEAALDRMRYDE